MDLKEYGARLSFHPSREAQEARTLQKTGPSNLQDQGILQPYFHNIRVLGMA